MKILRWLIAVIGAMASVGSGLFWFISAKMAEDAAAITGASKSAQDAIRTLQTLALQANSKAAFAAAVAGFALAVVVMLEQGSETRQG